MSPETRARVGLAARLLLAALFLFSGIEKAWAPAEDFVAVVEAYKLVPPELLMPFATLLPLAEIVLGLSLLLGAFVRAACAGGALLNLVFIAALGSTLARGLELESCGCFGGVHLTPLQAMSVDAFMIALAALAWRCAGPLFALDGWMDGGD